MEINRSQITILAAAWATILATSLFKIVTQEIFNYKVNENLQYGVMASIVVAGFILTWVWTIIRPLRPFFGVFMALVGAQWLVYIQVDRLPVFRRWLNDPSFNVSLLAEQSLNLMVALIVIGFLFILHRKRQAFYLAAGDTAAPVEPIRWLGVKEGETWKKLGWILAVCISLGTLAFLVIAGRPPIDIVVKALPFLPVVLLAAAVNAFYEEMSYKASFLSVLVDVVGKPQALLLMAAYFGIWHFYGVPYGVVGVILAGFLGWILGKSMVETHGSFWAWFIHFLQDVLIFSFMAIGSITPGG